MRVLGVDPGLTRCGLGVVEGAPAAGAPWWRSASSRTPPHERHLAQRLVLLADAARRLARPVSSPTPSPSSGCSPQHNVRTVMGTAQASAVAMLAAARRGLRGPAHAQRGQGRRHRQRRAPTRRRCTAMVTRILRPRRRAEARRRRRRPRPGHLPPLAPAAGRRATSAWTLAQPAWAAPSAARRRKGRSRPDRSYTVRSRRGVSASLRGRVVTFGSTRRSSRSAASACSCTRTPAHARRAARGRGGDAGHHAGRPRGLADAVRLRRRRRARRLRAVQTVSRRRAAARPGDARGAQRPTRSARAVGDRGPQGATKVPGHRQEGRPADRARAAGPARVPGRASCGGRGAAAGRPRSLARPGRRGPGRPRLVGQAGRGRRRRGRRRRRGASRDVAELLRVGPARAGRATSPGRRLRRRRSTRTAPSTRRRASIDADGDGDERAVEAALRPRTARRVRRPAACPRAARPRARGRPAPAGARPTTCCSPGRPGSARPPWR